MTKILVIEDEVDVLSNLIENLTYEGYDAQGAPNGQQGVEKAIAWNPDLILCDILMPEMNGYEVLHHLRNESALQTVPFIFLTALATPYNQRQGMEYGADDYLTKPFNMPDVLTAIETQLEKSRKRQEQYQHGLDNLRHNIMYALPHEFNTPLSSLIGTAEFLMVEASSLSTKDIRDMARLIAQSGRRLERLSKNYLQYAQIQIIKADAERLAKLQEERIDYAGMILTGVGERISMEYYRVDDIELESTMPSADLHISHHSLEKIISELLDNAFKFSQAGDRVTIKTALTDDYFNIHIQDHGRGMSQQDIQSIGAYSQFNRVVYEQQGLGFGLTITRELVALHNGHLTIDSQIDQGTTVTVSLKYDPA